jgi:hypothetical protein
MKFNHKNSSHSTAQGRRAHVSGVTEIIFLKRGWPPWMIDRT